MLLREVDYARPATLDEAIEVLAGHEGARALAGGQVRNRGTIGGNVCVSDPTNHLPPLLVALDARFTIRGRDGERAVGAEEFFQGVYLTAVVEGELLTKVSV